jgi:hypothetical protein
VAAHVGRRLRNVRHAHDGAAGEFFAGSISSNGAMLAKL